MKQISLECYMMMQATIHGKPRDYCGTYGARESKEDADKLLELNEVTVAESKEGKKKLSHNEVGAILKKWEEDDTYNLDIAKEVITKHSVDVREA